MYSNVYLNKINEPAAIQCEMCRTNAPFSVSNQYNAFMYNISTAFCSVVLLWERSLNLTKSNNCWYVLEFKNLFDIHSSDENETRIKQLVYHNTWGWGGIPFEQKKPNNIIYPVCDSFFRFFVSSFKSSEENKSIIYAANISKNS